MDTHSGFFRGIVRVVLVEEMIPAHSLPHTTRTWKVNTTSWKSDTFYYTSHTQRNVLTDCESMNIRTYVRKSSPANVERVILEAGCTLPQATMNFDRDRTYYVCDMRNKSNRKNNQWCHFSLGIQLFVVQVIVQLHQIFSCGELDQLPITCIAMLSSNH